jgi:hemerythrin-like metal-binding protein
MLYFEWDDSLKTGIEKIDDQHKRLIDIVNELSDAMRSKKGKDVLGHVLDELSEYTNYHFAFEERAFEKYGYPQADAHVTHHKELIRQLQELVDKFKKNELGISIDVLDFVTNWVKNHIQKEDMLYVPHLKDKDLG